MKKYLPVLLLIILCLALASCAPARVSARQAMTDVMEAVKATDIVRVRELMGTDTILGAPAESERSEGSEASEETQPADESGITKDQVAAIFKNISYKILSASEDKETATIEIEITNKDMQSVFDNYMAAAVDMFLSEDNEELTEEEQAAKFGEILIKLIEEEEDYVTSTVTVEMSYKDGKWTIDPNPEFFNALMGGLDLTMPDQE